MESVLVGCILVDKFYDVDLQGINMSGRFGSN
jgi:hypothetical protein